MAVRAWSGWFRKRIVDVNGAKSVQIARERQEARQKQAAKLKGTDGPLAGLTRGEENVKGGHKNSGF